MLGPCPYGTRLIYEITGGHVEGARLNGKVLTGGADWMLIGPDGWGRLDVRGHFLTNDGATIYVHYDYGLIAMNENVQRVVAGGAGTDYGDQYLRTCPQFEAGDPRYAWLNQSVFVAEGRVRPGPSVEFRVYRLV